VLHPLPAVRKSTMLPNHLRRILPASAYPSSPAPSRRPRNYIQLPLACEILPIRPYYLSSTPTPYTPPSYNTGSSPTPLLTPTSPHNGTSSGTIVLGPSPPTYHYVIWQTTSLTFHFVFQNPKRAYFGQPAPALRVDPGPCFRPASSGGYIGGPLATLSPVAIPQTLSHSIQSAPWPSMRRSLGPGISQSSAHCRGRTITPGTDSTQLCTKGSDKESTCRTVSLPASARRTTKIRTYGTRVSIGSCRGGVCEAPGPCSRQTFGPISTVWRPSQAHFYCFCLSQIGPWHDSPFPPSSLSTTTPHLSNLASPSPPTTQSSSFTRVGVATPGTAAPMNVATPPFGLPRPGEASQE
jgi:hypothetical protein